MSLVLTALKWLALIAAGAFVAFAVYIRVAGDDPAVWHQDPATVGLSGAVNEYIVSPSGDDAMRASPVYAMTPEALAAAFEAVALAKPGVTMLSNEGGFTTYIQRTTVMAYPDYVSVRAVAAEGGAALFVYSRSRYGKADFGVNEARVSAWLDEL